ncbi:MAG: hypothetical protein AAGM67_18050, partial [Bacteroidota bacterium]
MSRKHQDAHHHYYGKHASNTFYSSLRFDFPKSGDISDIHLGDDSTGERKIYLTNKSNFGSVTGYFTLVSGVPKVVEGIFEVLEPADEKLRVELFFCLLRLIDGGFNKILEGLSLDQARDWVHRKPYLVEHLQLWSLHCWKDEMLSQYFE